MNKRGVIKRFFSCLLLLTLVTTLSSCSLIFSFIEGFINGQIDDILGSIENDYASYEEIPTPEENIVKNREGNHSGYNISLLKEKENEGYEILPSIGEQKVLVIPIYFKDYTPFSCMDDPLKGLENIHTAFFGESEETGWESVKSYYYKSSYGKFNLGGMVTSWCPIDKTLKEIIELDEYGEPSVYCLREAVKWAKQTYPNIANEYDLDKDGYIDSVALVYANDYYDGSGKQSYDKDYKNHIDEIESLLWAYTYWDYEKSPSVESPVGNVYTFLSYDFLFDGEYYKEEIKDNHIIKTPLVDTHTYIHEFGHVLGLDDYYSYDFLDDEPLGKLDMMDNNIGDHNAYSKYLLNWLDPILIEEAGTYTISSLSKEGSALLIPANIDKFSYSPFSEYLLLELYCPDGLNELDSKVRYQKEEKGTPYHFTKTGVKILHVDSRLVVVDDTEETYYYTNVFNDTLTHPSKIQFIGANNTSSYSINPDFKLINLISSEKGRNAFDVNYYASNRDLFTKNDIINAFEFNSGDRLKFNIEIVKIDEEKQSATISITNN